MEIILFNIHSNKNIGVMHWDAYSRRLLFDIGKINKPLEARKKPEKL